MASYEQTVKNICERDVITAYTDVLTDINYCINLFANLETKQTFTEFLMDWYAGERVQINTESFLIDLNNLKEEIQSGIKLYIELFSQIKVFKSLLTIYDSNSESIGYSNKSTARFEFIQRLRSQFEALLLAIQYIETPKRMQCKDGIFWHIQYLGSQHIQPGFKERAKLYELSKILYQTINLSEILKIFRENHARVSEMIIEIDVTIAKTINLEVWTANNPNTETSGQRQEPNSDTTAIGREQLCGNTEEILKQNSGESLKSKYNGVKVTKIYYETIMKEMKILASSKPEMSEELREKTAIIVAERICKAFMKENLCLSDLEINELLKELQH